MMQGINGIYKGGVQKKNVLHLFYEKREVHIES